MPACLRFFDFELLLSTSIIYIIRIFRLLRFLWFYHSEKVLFKMKEGWKRHPSLLEGIYRWVLLCSLSLFLMVELLQLSTMLWSSNRSVVINLLCIVLWRTWVLYFYSFWLHSIGLFIKISVVKDLKAVNKSKTSP